MARAAIVEFVRPAASHLETLAGAGSNVAAIRSVDDKTELHVGNTPHLCLPLSTSHFSPHPQENYHEAHFSSSRPYAWRCRIFASLSPLSPPAQAANTGVPAADPEPSGSGGTVTDECRATEIQSNAARRDTQIRPEQTALRAWMRAGFQRYSPTTHQPVWRIK